MRISKIIVALLVSVVALTAMTGVAVAVAGPGEEIWSCDENGNPTDTFYSGGKVYVTDNSSNTLTEHAATGKIWIVDNANWGPGFDGTDLSTWSHRVGSYTDVYVGGIGVNASGKFNGTSVTNGVVEICDVNVLDVPYGYDILYDADGDGYYNCTATSCPDKVDKRICTGFDTEVPEFATIAIPAIAVLGLFLFFNKRKHKKE